MSSSDTMARKSTLRLLVLTLLANVGWSFNIPPHAISPSHHPTRRGGILMSATDSNEGQHLVSIEYCSGCRWMLKSFWMAQEMLSTFAEELDAVTILQSTEKGIFDVKLNGSDILWNRKEEGRFPQPKQLKQLLRDRVVPAKFLGHSDTEQRQSEKSNSVDVKKKPEWGRAPSDTGGSSSMLAMIETGTSKGNVAIEYCTGCNWLLRAAYFGQELFTTFSDGELQSVTLLPSKPPAEGGQFTIWLDGSVIYDRKQEGRFPEVKEIKQIVRDVILPEKDLGHSDVKEEMDDDEAADSRKFFGVA